GSYLIQMATGLGKTVVFTQYINQIKGRVLIISHREELVFQPIKYLSRTYGIEMSNLKSDNQEVISSCITSLARRYKKFKPDEFDLIIVDEAHHSAANSYVKVLKYFKPRLVLGFTATPNRADNRRLDQIFDRIIYQYDLLKGIRSNYLSNIYCKRVYVKYDLSKVKKSNNDYQLSDLENELIDSENPKSIGEIYKQHRVGQTLIFGTTVKHCEEISKHISNSVVISANTKNRAEIIKKFTNKEIPCIVNCMIFTEGTDLPLIETIIMARPTKNSSLYSQMIGRGLRLAEGKEKLLLIDCVGVSTDLNLCTAPTLLGIDYNDEKVKKDENKVDLEGDLFDIPAQIEKRENYPDNWKINYKVINLWARKKGYNLHDVNWFKHSDGSFSLQIKNIKLKTSPIDELGKLKFKGIEYEAQDFFDRVRKQLDKKYKKHQYIWDLSIMKYWGYKPATPKQLQLIKRFLPNFNTDKLNKLQANQILTKLMNK
ncbi:MAG: DEAD/DEAH box helicase, partial [Promethearchaeota archaeon]